MGYMHFVLLMTLAFVANGSEFEHSLILWLLLRWACVLTASSLEAKPKSGNVSFRTVFLGPKLDPLPSRGYSNVLTNQTECASRAIASTYWPEQG